MSVNGPEWNVYDSYRTAALNVCYAEKQIKKLSNRNFWIEAAVTTTATGAGLTGLGAVFGTSSEVWKFIWLVLTGSAAVASWLKPLLRTVDTIAAFETSRAGYVGLQYDLEAIARAIRRDNAYTADHDKLFSASQDRKKELVAAAPPAPTDDKLLAECEEAIRLRFPVGYPLFYSVP